MNNAHDIGNSNSSSSLRTHSLESNVMTEYVESNCTAATFSRRKFAALAGGALASLALAPIAAAKREATPSAIDFDALLAEAIEAGVPGIALSVSRDRELIFSGAAGVSNLETQAPVRPDDRFRIYSIAKAFAATVVLQLVDEGVLSLDDTVTHWLDSSEVLAIPNVNRITLRQLLTHTSGIYDFADDLDSPFWEDAFLGPNADWSRVWTIEELLSYAAAENHDAYFAPGEGNHYSNTGYLLLGLIVEQATGKTYGDELRSRVIDPLGLENTFLAEGGAMPEGTISGYQVIDDELIDVSSTNLSWIWTAGGMVSTTGDLLALADALFSGALLTNDSIDEMFTFVATESPQMGEGMGIYRIETDYGTLTGMDGGGPGFNSTLMRHADSGITVAILGNVAPDLGVDALRDRVITAMIEDAT